MCQANTHDRIRAVMAQMTRRQPADFTPPTTLEELDIDSLDRAEIALELENAFGIYIDRGQDENWLTVGDIFKTVEELHG